MGSVMPAQAYYKAQKLKVLVRHQIHEALERYDVLALPTAGKTAQRVEGYDELAVSSVSYVLTPMFNLAGCPAISVPCGLSTQRLPIGLQLGGRPGGEETLLKVAHAYESSTPWHTMRPPTV